MSERQQYIRNFCIIAHIDHGKSTLADRLIEATGVLTAREMENQVLDNMDLERERGITIKAQSVRMVYRHSDGREYILNLIDTPGHVDFNYEVSRSLAACEGAILVVDAAQGVEAQTLANVYLAIDNNLEILPVLNKVDLPSADPEAVRAEIEDVIGIDASMAPCISAKNKINIQEVFDRIIDTLPPPKGDENAPLRGLVFDSYYDSYKGVIVHVSVKNGSVRTGDTIRFMNSGSTYLITELGYFKPGGYVPANELLAGDVGYIIASIKNVRDITVGDTVTLDSRPAAEPLPGYHDVHPMVYCGIYPLDGSEYDELKDAMEKLQLNDAAFHFEPETSAALGFGFRCGFLGLLHMEIVQERLEREYDMDIITTAPSVIYKVHKTDGTSFDLDNPSNLPPVTEIEYMEEPIVSASIMTPKEYVGNIMQLVQDRRGVYLDMKYLDANRVILEYDIPLNEIIYDFFDSLKSRTKGYASFDYNLKGYAQSDLVKLDFYMNGEIVDALSFIVFRDNAYPRARRLAERLKDVIPRQQFEVPIQAYVGGKIIARETVRAYRKDVTAKCYGGDITRKKKLLEKQKEGKKRMRQFGTVEIPQEAFMEILKID